MSSSPHSRRLNCGRPNKTSPTLTPQSLTQTSPLFTHWPLQDTVSPLNTNMHASASLRRAAATCVTSKQTIHRPAAMLTNVSRFLAPRLGLAPLASNGARLVASRADVSVVTASTYNRACRCTGPLHHHAMNAIQPRCASAMQPFS